MLRQSNGADGWVIPAGSYNTHIWCLKVAGSHDLLFYMGEQYATAAVYVQPPCTAGTIAQYLSRLHRLQTGPRQGVCRC